MAITRRDAREALLTGSWIGSIVSAGFYFVYFSLSELGWDAHAYWLAWDGSMYDRAPGTRDAYLYSPAFAQLEWPFTLLPWPVYLGALVIAMAITLAWMLKPLGLAWGVPTFLILCPLAIVPANIQVFLGLAIALSIRWPATWAFLILTKVSAGFGILWYGIRREWRQLFVATASTSVVVGASALIRPGLWVDWVHFLLTTQAAPNYSNIPSVPLWPRLIVAAIVLVWGAKTNRRWTLPIVVALTVPAWHLSDLVILAAIPRINSSEQPENAYPVASKTAMGPQGWSEPTLTRAQPVALEVSREAQARTGLSIKKTLQTLRPLRSATLTLGGVTTTVPSRVPDKTQNVLDDLMEGGH